MKIKFTLLALVASGFFGMNAQVIITENFNNPSTLTLSSSGWIEKNMSSPPGITSWFTGVPGVFPAFSGPDSSYIAANYNNTTGSNGTISDWLITPTVTLNNGGILQFATRTNTAAPQSISPDRLQVYVSTSGTVTDVGTTSTSLGTFSTLVVAVNPSLTNTGYPTAWTVYTTTLTGITGTVTGRFGFRYFVTSAGPSGANSSYIGIDNVRYELPCPNPTLSVISSTTGICSGNTFNIAASGANTYTWSSGQNTPSVTLSPTATTVYTLTASSIPNCNSTGTVAVSVTLTPVLSVSNLTTCPGTAATLVASGASTYSWSTGSTSATAIDTPTINTTYTVTGYNGNCMMTTTVSVALGASLSINASASQNTICSSKSATIIASGASSYSYTSGTFSTTSLTGSVTVTPTASAVYTVNGSSGACLGTNTVLINVNPSPVLSYSSTGGTVLCANTNVTFSVSGAATYTWVGNNSNNQVLTVITPSTSGSASYLVIGTSTNGCSTSTTIAKSVVICLGIESLSSNNTKPSIYPNPFTNELKVSGFNGSVEIYNALGQLIAKENINNIATLNTNELVKGLYIMKAYSDENKLITTMKLIKN